jgi:hypothetical protein
LKEEVLNDVVELLPMLRKIPRRLEHITGALERGELSLRIRPPSPTKATLSWSRD